MGNQDFKRSEVNQVMVHAPVSRLVLPTQERYPRLEFDVTHSEFLGYIWLNPCPTKKTLSALKKPYDVASGIPPFDPGFC